jgi:hypothetical protein
MGLMWGVTKVTDINYLDTKQVIHMSIFLQGTTNSMELIMSVLIYV